VVLQKEDNRSATIALTRVNFDHFIRFVTLLLVPD
jgi:hypothetical protein